MSPHWFQVAMQPGRQILLTQSDKKEIKEEEKGENMGNTQSTTQYFTLFYDTVLDPFALHREDYSLKKTEWNAGEGNSFTTQKNSGTFKTKIWCSKYDFQESITSRGKILLSVLLSSLFIECMLRIESKAILEWLRRLQCVEILICVFCKTK